MQETCPFEKRYPNLSFLLRFQEKEPLDFPLHSNDLPQEVARAIKPLNLSQLEVVYIYGLGEGHYYFPLKKWLAKNKERDLIFIEENLSGLVAFLEMDHAEEILSHPQVHIRFNLDKKKLTPFLKECAESFPVDKMGIISLSAYKKHYPSRFYDLRLKLHRFSTVQHAIFIENHYYSHFFKNLIPNFHRMETSFDGNGLKDQFANIPAIICGAGPSLENDIKTLKSLENHALIFAGGSAIPALSSHGIDPHFGVAIDPNFEEVKRFQKSTVFELPLLYAPRLHPEVFNYCNGPHGYLHTKTGGPLESYLEEKLGLELLPLKQGFTQEALSVTTTAIEVAATFGCNPIILLGVDLAFTGGQTYTSGVVASPKASLKKQKQEVRVSELLLKRKDIYNKPIDTLVKWVMESSAISTFAKKNPSIEMINATSGGLGFASIPNASLNNISMPPPRDLHSLVHQAIQTHPLPVSSGAVSKHLSTLNKSLLKAKSHIKTALNELERIKGTNRDPETGKLIFAQMELETLDAYTCFLEEPSRTFPFRFDRMYRPATWGETSNALKWEVLYAKWKAYETLVEYYTQQRDLWPTGCWLNTQKIWL